MELSSLKNEEEFIKKAKANPEYFEIIFEKYYEKIFNYVLGRVGDAAVAQDITSESFFKAFKNLWRFEWQGIPFSAWLYRIANNETKKYFRNKQYRPCSLDELLQNNNFEIADRYDLVGELKITEEELAKHQKFLQVQKLILKLSLKDQEVLTLRFFENKKFLEIAQILGKKESTVKSLVSRALAKIVKLLQEENISETQLFLQSRIIEGGREKS